jgi:hypothetical protein
VSTITGGDGDNLGDHTPVLSIVPASDNTIDLGSGINGFRNIYVKGSVNFSAITQDDNLNKVLVSDVNGQMFWRDASSIYDGSPAGDNLGNHTATQTIVPIDANSYDIGSPALPFNDLFLAGDVNLSGITQNDSHNRILVSDLFGKMFWRDASSITGSSPNLPYVISGTSLGVGSGSLANTTSYDANSAFGFQSLHNNSTGRGNTAHGYQSLLTNTTGASNTGMGTYALRNNTEGSYNTALGSESCLSNSRGNGNTAVGLASLSRNSSGSYNTAQGFRSLNTNISGNNNCAFGTYSMRFNEIGENNTAVGALTLYENQTGSGNTAIGYQAGPNVSNLSNTTAIGNRTMPTASNQVRIGNSDVTSIGGQVSWSTLSDGRFKKELKEDVSGLEFINQLRPVSYTIDKNAVDAFLGLPDSVIQKNSSARQVTIRQTGFVAQEVETLVKKTGFVFNGVEAPENDKDHYSIRYAEFVVPLVKAVQELTAMVEEQRKQIELLTMLSGNHAVHEDEDEGSGTLRLHQNQPNPFQRDTKITMDIPQKISQATLYIYDLQGKTIEKQVIHGRGATSINIEGGRLPSGIYLYTLIGDGQATEVKRMILTE